MNTNIKDGLSSFFHSISGKSIYKISYIILVAAVIFLAVYLYLVSRSLDILSSKVSEVESRLSSTTAELRVGISESYTILSNDINSQKQSVGTIEQKLGEYKQEVGDFTGTVSNLQKLSKTDPELLEKYSKVFFLNENYAPARFAEIPNQYKYSDAKTLKLSAPVWPYMQRMIDDAARANITIYVQSAYRSFNEQQALKGQYSVIYGAGSANTFSADQGYSEHQLGTTVDFITPGLGGSLDGFENTKAYTWLVDNAYKYGFILSYPKSNSFYVFEPWHWRFVGVKLATYLHDQKKDFYEMDQRDIDEYLVNLFD